MRRDPRVTLLRYDPRKPLRYLEVRGTIVDMTEEGAAEHLDALASKYVGRPIRYFGGCDPAASPRPRSRSCAGFADPCRRGRRPPAGGVR